MSVPLFLVLTSCASTSGFQERPERIDTKLERLQKDYFLPGTDVLAEYNKPERPDKQSYRDNVVHGRLLAIDMQYGLFKQALYEEGVTTNVAIDTLGVVVGTAGAAVTGSDGSRILSALSGGISGTGTAINENLYYKRTLPALLALMDAKREAIRAEIISGLTTDHNTYPLGRALVDLERYVQAGSIPGAISEILASAGEAKSIAEEKIEITRDREFIDAKAQERIDRLIDVANQLPENAALDILRAPPSEIDSETLVAIRGVLGGVELGDAISELEDMEAKKILKMILVLMADRNEENVAVWKAAMIAASQGE